MGAVPHLLEQPKGEPMTTDEGMTVVPATLTPEVVARTRAAMHAARRQFGPNAGDGEWSLFLEVALRMNLSPFRDEICLVPYGGVHKPQVTVHGRRVLARRTGQLRGIEGPYWCGPHRPEPDSPLEWVDAWVDARPPHAARVIVHRDGETPYVGTAPWRIFNKNTPAWRDMDSHMLAKVAEVIALRRAFPDVVVDDAVFEYDDVEAEPAAGYRPVDVAPDPRAVGAAELVDARGIPAALHVTPSYVLVGLRRVAEREGITPPTSLAAVDARLVATWRAEWHAAQVDEP
jgi:hypothetical protein